MKKNNGFTIVEVSLVLGIAGLIMIMAFVALPSLWSSQRDADRRANVMNLISALKTFQTNNSRGALPTGTGTYTVQKPVTGASDSNWAGFIQDYYLKNSNSLEDPGGNLYQIKIFEGCDASVAVGDYCDISSDANFSNNINRVATPKYEIDTPVIYVVKGATCDEDKNAIVKTANNRYVAAVQVLEKGKYCQNT